jgi:hypothetical protein
MTPLSPRGRLDETRRRVELGATLDDAYSAASKLFQTYEDASTALRVAEADVLGDLGETELDYASFADLVRYIAGDATPEVAAELLRRNL